MAPFVTLDNTSDLATPVTANSSPGTTQTLLLSPPSLSAHPETLTKVLSTYDRQTTDLQMLDRLALGLVSLPPNTYDLILLLSDIDGSRAESQRLLGREVMAKVHESLKAGGALRSQDRSFGSVPGADKTEAILAGLILNGSSDGMMKPADTGDNGLVMLKFGKKNGNATTPSSNGNGTVEFNHKRKAETQGLAYTTAGVGFVDFSDDLDIPIITGEDDELIDEDDLLTEEDLKHGIVQPVECRPKPGKRRRACANCSCGLKEKLEAEDAVKRKEADEALSTLKLDVDDLAEVDFTVQGKLGSCGNCALGDAFRCAGCPFIGLPSFRPGEEVRLLNNDVQL